jgi:hypothetical protein
MPLNATAAPAPVAAGTTTRVVGAPVTRTRGAAGRDTVMEAPPARAGSTMSPPVRVMAVTLGSNTMVVVSPGWAPAVSASRRLPGPAGVERGG